MNTTNTSIVGICPHCGMSHGPRCPEVRAIEYHPDGTVKRIEYLTPADRLQPLGRDWFSGPWPWQPAIVGDPWVSVGGTAAWDGRTLS